MNIVFMNPKSSHYIIIVAHTSQFLKVFLVFTLSNHVFPTPLLGSQELGLQANVGHICFPQMWLFCIFFLVRNKNWWDIEKLPH